VNLTTRIGNVPRDTPRQVDQRVLIGVTRVSKAVEFMVDVEIREGIPKVDSSPLQT